MAVCEIECSRCNKVHSYDCENLEWECVGSEERQMGRENEYNATIEDTCSCEQNMTVTFKCWEYPVGITAVRLNIDQAQLV